MWCWISILIRWNPIGDCSFFSGYIRNHLSSALDNIFSFFAQVFLPRKVEINYYCLSVATKTKVWALCQGTRVIEWQENRPALFVQLKSCVPVRSTCVPQWQICGIQISEPKHNATDIRNELLSSKVPMAFEGTTDNQAFDSFLFTDLNLAISTLDDSVKRSTI